ncbi:MAG TPA: alpha/beta fold hydrolase [Telluria sp.]
MRIMLLFGAGFFCLLFLSKPWPAHAASEYTDGPNATARAPIVRLKRESVDELCVTRCQDKIAVVFIHGLFGSRETWLNVATNAFWPHLIASDDSFNHALDVYVVDYDSFLLRKGPSATQLRDEMAREIDALLSKKYKQIVLIGHSLGGILARAYLLHVKTAFGHRALNSFGNTITLGSPGSGASIANLGRILSANQQLRVLTPIEENDFQQLLTSSWSDVDKKRLTRTHCDLLVTRAAYETLETPPIGLVVSKASATVFSSVAKGFALTHEALAKPASMQDELYKWVKEPILECAKGTRSCGDGAQASCVEVDEPPSNPRSR